MRYIAVAISYCTFKVIMQLRLLSVPKVLSSKALTGNEEKLMKTAHRLIIQAHQVSQLLLNLEDWTANLHNFVK